jgi:transposase
MPKACSVDLRERVIEAVEEGASRREAAERFEVSVSSAIKWLQGWRLEGRRAPKPRGGSQSPLEDHAPALLALVGEHPDWTLAEFVVAMHKQKIPGSRSALWRFLERHGISRKKKPARDRARPRGRRPRAPALAAAAEAAQFVEPRLH